MLRSEDPLNVRDLVATKQCDQLAQRGNAEDFDSLDQLTSAACRSGTITRRYPAWLAANVAGSTPRAGRTRPSIQTQLDQQYGAGQPIGYRDPAAASTAETMARSKCEKRQT